MFFRSADDELRLLGFEKYEENRKGVTFHKSVPEHLFIHVLYIGINMMATMCSNHIR